MAELNVQVSSIGAQRFISDLDDVGRIMVLCVNRLYPPVLALRTSQSLRVRNPTTGMLFLIGFTKTHFLHLPNYGYWDVSYIVGKVWMRRLQRRWNRRKRFSSGGEILGTSLASVDLRGGIDSRSLSRPPSGLNCDVRLPGMLP